ncbi:TIGR04219 family outer membrane beta-barrel protein [Halioxenophilus sp. WMMB6]|uniref:TIGR04219 family outer membrane beta-barrel protein n=1 Tax=Halioxenophilus sp. WMMB6 TaxID=3073815 RepID=UPI00295EE748|nr:TIGR04219 family outer membrane beta-barrel protein [Halioxenophilus sp. WMMB6]
MLKKILATTLLCSAGSAMAAPVIDLKLAAGIWDTSASGDLGESVTDVDILNLDDDQATFYSVALEHPIPVIPNIRIKQTKLEYEGDAFLTENFTLDQQTFTVGADLLTDIDLSHTDYTLYWGLPEFYLDVDFGLTVRAFSGDATAVSNTLGMTETVDLDVAVPMLFADVRLDLPFTGLYLGAEVNGLSVGDSSMVDYNARIGYSTDIIPFLADLDFEVGYRSFSIELDESDIQSDITMDGPYAQIMIAF